MRLITFLVLFVSSSCVFAEDKSQNPASKYREAATKRWEAEIQKLEKLDKAEADPDDAVLFIGSSSIRRWTTISEDMKPWPAIRRGYGGARFSDLAVFIDRLVNPHQFDALVIFVGNDISGSKEDKEPEEVLELYKYIVSRVRIEHADQPIFCIGVTPTSSRWDVWPKVEKMNGLIREYSEGDKSLYFIDTAASYLGKDGKPKDELFVKDLLHLNAEGYKVWAEIIKTSLSKAMKHGE